jgi:hypothetical protein
VSISKTKTASKLREILRINYKSVFFLKISISKKQKKMTDSPIPFPISQQQSNNNNENNNNVVLHSFLGRRYVIVKNIGIGAMGLAMLAKMPYHDNQLVVVKRLKQRAPGYGNNNRSNNNTNNNATPTPPPGACYRYNSVGNHHHQNSQQDCDFHLVTSPIRRMNTAAKTTKQKPILLNPAMRMMMMMLLFIHLLRPSLSKLKSTSMKFKL